MNILAIECSKDAYDDAQLKFRVIDNVLVRRQNGVLAIGWFGWMKMCVNLMVF